MATRCILEFRDDAKAGPVGYLVYNHWDGYAEGIADKIAATINSGLAWELPRFESDEFAAAFIAANKKEGGGYRLIHNGGRLDCGTEYWHVISPHNASVLVETYETTATGRRGKFVSRCHVFANGKITPATIAG